MSEIFKGDIIDAVKIAVSFVALIALAYGIAYFSGYRSGKDIAIRENNNSISEVYNEQSIRN